MNIDLENITQASQWFDANLFTPYYEKLSAVPYPGLLRLSSPFIGIGDGVMSTAQAVCGLSETLLKGSINTVLGIANWDRNQIKKGMLQVVLGGGIISLTAIPIIAVRTLRITANVAYDPVSAISELYRKIPVKEVQPVKVSPTLI